MREHVLDNADKKQQVLMEMFTYSDKQPEKTAKDELLSLPEWPKKDVEVVARFTDQVVPGTATGFSIGGALVITAGHVADDPSDPISNYYAVFGMTKSMVSSRTFPAVAVHKIRRFPHPCSHLLADHLNQL